MKLSEQNAQYTRTGFYPPRTYLLIDDLYIDRMEGVKRTLCRPEKHPDPVLKPEFDWEGDCILPVHAFLYDEEENLFKLWYWTHDPKANRPELRFPYRRAYAVSEDAVHWERPNLGLVEWNGSRKNSFISVPEQAVQGNGNDPQVSDKSG